MLDIRHDPDLLGRPADCRPRPFAGGSAVIPYLRRQRFEMRLCLLGLQRRCRHARLAADRFGDLAIGHAFLDDGVTGLALRAAFECEAVDPR